MGFFLHICHENITEVITASGRHSLMKVQPQCVGSVMCARESVRVCLFEVKKCERGMFYLKKKGVCLCECLCIYNSEWACPLTGCVCQGPRPPSDGGLGAAVNLPRARHAMCW